MVHSNIIEDGVLEYFSGFVDDSSTMTELLGLPEKTKEIKEILQTGKLQMDSLGEDGSDDQIDKILDGTVSKLIALSNN